MDMITGGNYPYIQSATNINQQNEVPTIVGGNYLYLQNETEMNQQNELQMNPTQQYFMPIINGGNIQYRPPFTPSFQSHPTPSPELQQSQPVNEEVLNHTKLNVFAQEFVPMPKRVVSTQGGTNNWIAPNNIISKQGGTDTWIRQNPNTSNELPNLKPSLFEFDTSLKVKIPEKSIKLPPQSEIETVTPDYESNLTNWNDHSLKDATNYNIDNRDTQIYSYCRSNQNYNCQDGNMDNQKYRSDQNYNYQDINDNQSRQVNVNNMGQNSYWDCQERQNWAQHPDYQDRPVNKPRQEKIDARQNQNWDRSQNKRKEERIDTRQMQIGTQHLDHEDRPVNKSRQEKIDTRQNQNLNQTQNYKDTSINKPEGERIDTRQSQNWPQSSDHKDRPINNPRQEKIDARQNQNWNPCQNYEDRTINKPKTERIDTRLSPNWAQHPDYEDGLVNKPRQEKIDARQNQNWNPCQNYEDRSKNKPKEERLGTRQMQIGAQHRDHEDRFINKPRQEKTDVRQKQNWNQSQNYEDRSINKPKEEIMNTRQRQNWAQNSDHVDRPLNKPRQEKLGARKNQSQNFEDTPKNTPKQERVDTRQSQNWPRSSDHEGRSINKLREEKMDIRHKQNWKQTLGHEVKPINKDTDERIDITQDQKWEKQPDCPGRFINKSRTDMRLDKNCEQTLDHEVRSSNKSRQENINTMQDHKWEKRPDYEGRFINKPRIDARQNQNWRQSPDHKHKFTNQSRGETIGKNWEKDPVNEGRPIRNPRQEKMNDTRQNKHWKCPDQEDETGQEKMNDTKQNKNQEQNIDQDGKPNQERINDSKQNRNQKDRPVKKWETRNNQKQRDHFQKQDKNFKNGRSISQQNREEYSKYNQENIVEIDLEQDRNKKSRQSRSYSLEKDENADTTKDEDQFDSLPTDRILKQQRDTNFSRHTKVSECKQVHRKNEFVEQVSENTSLDDDDHKRKRTGSESLESNKSFDGKKQNAWDEKEFRKQRSKKKSLELFEEKKKYRDPKIERETTKTRISTNSYDEKYKRSSFGNTEEQKIEDLFDKSYKQFDEEYKDFLEELKNTVVCIPMKITEREQDLFEVPPTYSLAHCVAEDFRMGSGIAVTFRDRYKRVEELLDQKQRTGGLATLTDKTDAGARFLYYLVTKRRSFHKPSYKDIWRSIKKLREHIIRNNVKKLAIPKLGCGLDKLDWPTVKHIIEFLFKNVEIEILYCRFDNKEDQKKHLINIYDCTERLTDIKEKSVIIYFSSSDGHITHEMEELDKKYEILEGFKKSPNGFGKVIIHKTDKHIFCGCIVRVQSRDSFNFKGFKICIDEINRITTEDAYTGLAMNYVSDDKDKVLHHKVITMLKHYLTQVDVYVYKEDTNISVDDTSINS